MYGLDFDEIISIDTEYISRPGERPEVVCLVYRELGTGKEERLWVDELGPRPPFRVDAGVLFIGYYLVAEWSVFLQLGWPLPARSVDLFVEHRVDRNGIETPHEKRGLLDACSYHGLTVMTKDEKGEMRDLILSGRPWSGAERRALLEYCAADVVNAAALFERQVPAIQARWQGWGRAFLRAEAMKAVARMEANGVPLDTATLSGLRTHWSGIRDDLIEHVDARYGVFEKGELQRGLFARYLAKRGIPWPRTPSGLLELQADTLKDQARIWPELQPLRELLHSLGEMRLFDLEVGADGRNRLMLSPFRARTGRGQPSNSKFIFGPSVWLRGLIQPPPGRALVYVDWSAQEVGIVAALSGDEKLQAALHSGDVYLAFAKSAGLAPADATRESHEDVRSMCKVLVLAMNYGMSPATLAARLGIGTAEARSLQQLLQRTYPRFTQWSQEAVWAGTLLGYVETVFGWPQRGTYETRSTVLRNFPAQANGAELLRLATVLATHRGIAVAAPVHDALLVEGPADQIVDVATATRRAMADASRIVLDGFEIATDAKVIGPGERYADQRGAAMWDEVTHLLARRSAAA
jgi:hypothetical protein